MKGQSLVEFAIILGLVVVVGIAGFALLGDNITEMLGASKTSVEEFKPFGEGTASNPESPDPNQDPNSNPSPNQSKDGIPITSNPDGSIDFNVNGQEVILSSDVLDGIDTVFETSGSSGLQDHIVDTIAALIQKYEAEYAPADVPIEINFGKATRRMYSDNNDPIVGSAQMTQATIVVGDPAHKDDVKEVTMFVNEMETPDDIDGKKGFYEMNMVFDSGGVKEDQSSITTLKGDPLGVNKLDGSYNPNPGPGQGKWDLAIKHSGSDIGKWDIDFTL